MRETKFVEVGQLWLLRSRAGTSRHVAVILRVEQRAGLSDPECEGLTVSMSTGEMIRWCDRDSSIDDMTRNGWELLA